MYNDDIIILILDKYLFSLYISVWSWYKIDILLYDWPLYRAFICLLEKVLLITFVYFLIDILIIWAGGGISFTFLWAMDQRVIGVLGKGYIFITLSFSVVFLINWSVRSFSQIFKCARHHWKWILDINVSFIWWVQLMILWIRYWSYCWSRDYRDCMTSFKSKKIMTSKIHSSSTTKWWTHWRACHMAYNLAVYISISSTVANMYCICSDEVFDSLAWFMLSQYILMPTKLFLTNTLMYIISMMISLVSSFTVFC